ncbi:MAG: HAD family hydrolase [Betaproteobacteria bacterium]|jgi:HAD superfamily hydrolase (TIGR01490 family)|nr:HAD family hydrolase [Betaproteobacteria bacterium]NBZ98642.1 HAD family hydrolase [Betaproteobacteria bacterium]NDD24158.1 HAD family hydrolase [Betaproteobacteria bacterium]NDE23526.1 HAD family hydrolase [Betaproteobacteria bacterium]
MKLALFDLDNTLLPLDSDYAWGEFSQHIGWTDPVSFKARNDQFYADYQAGVLDIHDYVRFATDAVRLKGAEQAAKAHRQFMSEIILPAVKPAALELVKQHQAAGDQVIIVTATNEFVTRPIATALGVSELIAVELMRDAQGWITGEISGTPSFKEGKVTRVAQWLSARHLTWSDVHISFYSDSINDLPLLEMAQTPVATNPDARLRQLATDRGWRILQLFS